MGRACCLSLSISSIVIASSVAMREWRARGTGHARFPEVSTPLTLTARLYSDDSCLLLKRAHHSFRCCSCRSGHEGMSEGNPDGTTTIERETIERYICSTGQEKGRKNYVGMAISSDDIEVPFRADVRE